MALAVAISPDTIFASVPAVVSFSGEVADGNVAAFVPAAFASASDCPQPLPARARVRV